MEQILGKNLKNHENEEFNLEKFEQVKIVLLYFAATYCPPSQNFTPLLKSFYEEMNCQNPEMEIVYISLDFDETEFKKAVEEFPWPHYQLQDPKIKELVQKYEITGIPRVVVLDKFGSLISKEGRKEISLNGERAFLSWCQDLLERTSSKELSIKEEILEENEKNQINFKNKKKINQTKIFFINFIYQNIFFN